MAVYRTDIDEVHDASGKLIASVTRDVDVTEEVVTLDLHAKARAALAANAAYLAIPTPTNAQNTAQTKRLTREVNALLRLLIGGDLLRDNADT